MKVASLMAMVCMVLLAGVVRAEERAGEIRLELPVQTELKRYLNLLSKPGYVAIALENNGLSPSLSSKLKVGDGGRSAEIRNAVLGFTSRQGDVFSYEAGVRLGLGDTTLTFPVKVDTSRVDDGTITVVMSPPLAQFFPTELIDRIRLKTRLIANPAAQRQMLEYLNGLADGTTASTDNQALIEAILLEAYNKSGGLRMPLGRDVGDAVPLSDQWLLILTLAIWFVVVPVILFVQRRRQARQRPA